MCGGRKSVHYLSTDVSLLSAMSLISAFLSLGISHFFPFSLFLPLIFNKLSIIYKVYSILFISPLIIFQRECVITCTNTLLHPAAELTQLIIVLSSKAQWRCWARQQQPVPPVPSTGAGKNYRGRFVPLQLPHKHKVCFISHSLGD